MCVFLFVMLLLYGGGGVSFSLITSCIVLDMEVDAQNTDANQESPTEDQQPSKITTPESCMLTFLQQKNASNSTKNINVARITLPMWNSFFLFKVLMSDSQKQSSSHVENPILHCFLMFEYKITIPETCMRIC